jgi:parallel beta-helix repeat protein
MVIKNINLIFMLSLVLAFVAPAMGATLTVPSATYPTIASAITAAGTGDTIYVLSTYSPTVESYPIVIGKSNLTITGPTAYPPVTTIYNPDVDSDGIEQGEDIFRLGAVNNVTIQFIKFENCCFAITETGDAAKTDITVFRNYFVNCHNEAELGDSTKKYGWDGGAVHLSNISNSMFSYNNIKDCGEGIYLYNSDYNSIGFNIIDGNGQFGIQLNINFYDNEITYNKVSNCHDRGIVLLDDTDDWEDTNHKQFIDHNEVWGCNAEGILIWGNEDDGSMISWNKVYENCKNGKFAALGEGYENDCYGTNYAGIALVNTISQILSSNYVHHNGELDYHPPICYGGIAILGSKNIHIETSVFEYNTGDYSDPLTDCAVTLVSVYHPWYGNSITMDYCDIMNQNYGARNISVYEDCMYAYDNWWGNPYGPDDFSNGGCQIVYNPNTPHPKVNDKVMYAQWEDNMLAIELEGFRATPHLKNSVLCEWSTGSEQDNAGFYLVKSEHLDKGYTLVNDRIIAAKGDTVTGANYSYLDQNVKAHTLYFYWLVDVSFDGQFTINGPVFAVYESDDSYWESLR